MSFYTARVMNRPRATVGSSPLTEALVEDIINTPPETLRAEIAEDHGDPLALVKEFDAIVGQAVRGRK